MVNRSGIKAPGSGRKTGTPNKSTVERALKAAQAIERSKASGRRLAKEHLDDFLHVFADISVTYQPKIETDEAGRRKPVWAPGDEAQFEKYARLAIETATQLAKYQSPTFRAIAIGAPAVQDDDNNIGSRGSIERLRELIEQRVIADEVAAELARKTIDGKATNGGGEGD